MSRRDSAQYEASLAKLDALVLAVAQATAELIHEEYGPAPNAMLARKRIASEILRATIGCAREDPDSEYRAVVDALGVEEL